MIEQQISKDNFQETINSINELRASLNEGPLNLETLKRSNLKPIISPNVRIGHQSVSADNNFFKDQELFQIGEGSILDEFCTVSAGLHIGEFTHIAPHCVLAGGRGTRISVGNFSGIAAHSVLYTASDTPSDLFTILPPEFQIPKGAKGDIEIGDFVAIGSQTFISPHNHIPEGVFIGVQSRVPSRFQFEPWGIYVMKLGEKGNLNLTLARKRTPEEIDHTKKEGLLAIKTRDLYKFLTAENE